MIRPVEGVGRGGHPQSCHGAGQEASSQAPGAGPRDQQLRGVQLVITIIASSHQHHLSLQHHSQSQTISPTHHFSIEHIAATPVVVSPHIQRWKVCNPALSPIPAVQYSTVQYRTVQYSPPPVPGNLFVVFMTSSYHHHCRGWVWDGASCAEIHSTVME